jgi:hypothetical protein
MPLAKSCIVCGARVDSGASRCPKHEDRGHLLPRGCITCGRPTMFGDYCDTCEIAFERERSTQREASGARDHYKGDYQARANRIRRRAYAGLEVCWICGAGNLPGIKWHVDHVDPGNPDSELRAAHQPCNLSRGNRERAKAR